MLMLLLLTLPGRLPLADPLEVTGRRGRAVLGRRHEHPGRAVAVGRVEGLGQVRRGHPVQPALGRLHRDVDEAGGRPRGR